MTHENDGDSAYWLDDKEPMQVGKMVKVSLPGESPWAIVEEIYPDGRWMGLICNDLLCGDKHGYEGGDLVLFDKPYMANRGIMVSVPAKTN